MFFHIDREGNGFFIGDPQRAEKFSKLSEKELFAYSLGSVIAFTGTRGQHTREYTRWLRKTKPTYAILDAHGNNMDLTEYGEDQTDWWFYRDGANFYGVQDWINEVDGKFGALFVAPCNPKGVAVTSKRSCVIYSTDINNHQTIHDNPRAVEMFVPGKGLITLSRFNFPARVLNWAYQRYSLYPVIDPYIPVLD
jgi:hypothetical protein